MTKSKELYDALIKAYYSGSLETENVCIEIIEQFFKEQRKICSLIFEREARTNNIDLYVIKYISRMINNAPESK